MKYLPQAERRGFHPRGRLLRRRDFRPQHGVLLGVRAGFALAPEYRVHERTDLHSRTS